MACRALLLIVDQFEELFTQTGDDEERLQFIQALLGAIEVPDGPTSVILTMRSDFVGKCAIDGNLNTYVEENLRQLGPMQEAELRRAIEEPARLAGLEFEGGLVDDMLREALGAPGGLPLLEYTLSELYEARHGNLLTQKACQEIGGIRGALAKRATTEYEALDPAGQEILRNMFILRLIQPGVDTEDTRRRATKEELLATGDDAEAADEVLRRWIDARLLTTTSDLKNEQIWVDVAHEALIREWPMVQRWLEGRREQIRLIDHLHRAAQDWEREGRNADYLYKGAQLVRAEALYATHAGQLTRLERAFVEEGLAQRDRQRKEELERAVQLVRAKSKANRLLWSTATVVLLALVGVTLLALGLNSALQDADERLADNYWQSGREARKDGNSLLALHLMAEALQSASDQQQAKTIIQDISADVGHLGLARVFKHEVSVRGAVFNVDETRILTWGGDGTARLWYTPGDLDFPKDEFSLQLQVLTGTRFNSRTRTIEVIPAAEWRQHKDRYLSVAKEHANRCRFPHQNIYLRFYADSE